ncbi:MAG: insulinase family protein [Bacilli bacterium]|nr:insulinase family protein [Bacilli bacterium]
MNKFELIGLDRECFTETLSNGLEVYMIPLTNKKNYFISYATRFGSDILEFSKDNHKYKPPLGIAHFLEHKMFEQEDGVDPFTFFSNSGTDSNASTSFDSTQYICFGTKNFTSNLKYLLEFVNKPYYTDENVNKEKGIIAEEINMYGDIPDFKLEMKLRECLYLKHPRRMDIAGTVEEINKITKEDLYDCYNNFYVPNNMFVLIVGNFSPEVALNIIKEELAKEEEIELPVIKDIKEPDSVKTKEAAITGNIEVPKLAFGLKVPTKDINLSDLELDLYLHMLTIILFGASSEFREKVRQDKLMSSIYTEWESIEQFRIFYLVASTPNPKKLTDEIKKVLVNIPVDEKTFERIKKVWIAGEVKIYDNVDMVVNNSYDDIIKYHKIIPNRIEMIRKMKYKKLQDIITKIDFTNTSIVKMTNNK